MHRYGTLDIAARAGAAPRLKALGGEPWILKGVHILDCRMEIDAAPADALIPPSLRPGIPSYGAVVVTRVPDSPVGPFVLAELRVGVRIGAVAGFFVVGAVCDSEAARQALAERWGYRVAPGQVRLDDLYHQVAARVETAGRLVLDLRLTERRLLPGTRMNTPSIVNLAQAPDGSLTLVNAPLNAAYAQADGGPHIMPVFEGEAFGAGGAFRPMFPMGGAFGLADLTLGATAFTIDPLIPAEESVEAVDG